LCLKNKTTPTLKLKVGIVMPVYGNSMQFSNADSLAIAGWVDTAQTPVTLYQPGLLLEFTMV
jgi:hypothetical protein